MNEFENMLEDNKEAIEKIDMLQEFRNNMRDNNLRKIKVIGEVGNGMSSLGNSFNKAVFDKWDLILKPEEN